MWTSTKEKKRRQWAILLPHSPANWHKTFLACKAPWDIPALRWLHLQKGTRSLSFYRKTMLHHHGAEICLLKHSSSFTSRRGRCEAPSSPLTSHVLSLFVRLCPSGANSVLLFSRHLDLLLCNSSQRVFQQKHFKSDIAQRKPAACNALSTRRPRHLESTDKPTNSYHSSLLCPLTREGTRASLKTCE